MPGRPAESTSTMAQQIEWLPTVRTGSFFATASGGIGWGVHGFDTAPVSHACSSRFVIASGRGRPRHKPGAPGPAFPPRQPVT
jgi:hypothetical protein